MKLVYKTDRDCLIAWYISTDRLLTRYEEKGGSRHELAWRRAALDVWIGMIGATMNLDTAGDGKLHLRVTASEYHLTGRGCPDQTGHTNFEVWEGRSPGLLVQVAATEPLSLLVYPALYTDL